VIFTQRRRILSPTILFFILFFSLPVKDCIAQSSYSPADTIVSDIKTFFSDALTVYATPAHFGATGWLFTAGTVGVTYGSIELLDERTRRVFLRNQSSTGKALADIGNFNGTSLPGGVLAAGLYAGGLIWDKPGIRITGRHLVQSVAYAGVITTVLKYVIGRERPYLNHGPKEFHGPTFNQDYLSMPSGHSTVAFAISSSLAEDIGNTYASIGLYTLATLTAGSRIYSDKHWLSDTFVGAVLGTACGYAVTHIDEIKKSEGSSSLLFISPTLNGLAVTYTF